MHAQTHTHKHTAPPAMEKKHHPPTLHPRMDVKLQYMYNTDDCNRFRFCSVLRLFTRLNALLLCNSTIITITITPCEPHWITCITCITCITIHVSRVSHMYHNTCSTCITIHVSHVSQYMYHMYHNTCITCITIHVSHVSQYMYMYHMYHNTCITIFKIIGSSMMTMCIKNQS